MRPGLFWGCKVRPHLSVELDNLTLGSILHLNAEPPEEVRPLEGGGEVLHSNPSSKFEDQPQGFISVVVIRPVLMSLPLVVLNQLCDHHNHSDLSHYISLNHEK